MKNTKRSLLKVLMPALSILPVGFLMACNQLNEQTVPDYKILEYKTEIDEGNDKEVHILFERSRRKIAQLTLRHNMRLEPHSVKEPITIHCLSGSGELVVGAGENTKSIDLRPGTYITLEANVIHDVIARPSISILLVKFE